MSETMKKFFARILIIVMGIAAVFTGGNPENIKLELKDEVNTKTEVIEYTVLNYTGREMATGLDFVIEKNVDGQWVKLPLRDGYVVNEIGVIIRNLQKVSFDIHVVDAFGKTLDEGEYRLSKSDIGGSVEFTVTAA